MWNIVDSLNERHKNWNLNQCKWFQWKQWKQTFQPNNKEHMIVITNHNVKKKKPNWKSSTQKQYNNANFIKSLVKKSHLNKRRIIFYRPVTTLKSMFSSLRFTIILLKFSLCVFSFSLCNVVQPGGKAKAKQKTQLFGTLIQSIPWYWHWYTHKKKNCYRNICAKQRKMNWFAHEME